MDLLTSSIESFLKAQDKIWDEAFEKIKKAKSMIGKPKKHIAVIHSNGTIKLKRRQRCQRMPKKKIVKVETHKLCVPSLAEYKRR